MEILAKEQYDQFEQFVDKHKHGSFMQSPRWGAVKEGWRQEIVVSRDEHGAIAGGLSILVQQRMGTALLYAPRGPVCDWTDEAVLRDLVAGAKEVARRYRAYVLKIDPYVEAADSQTIALFRALGFSFVPNAPQRAVLQTRRDYMILDLQRYDEDALFMSIGRKTRNYVRHAQKHGVVVKEVTKEADGLRDFYDCYAETGRRQGFQVRSIDYFARILAAFQEDARLFVAYYEGAPMCGGLALTVAGRTCYVYGGSRGSDRRMHGTFLQQWEMMRYALLRGSRIYDMLGVVTDPEESPNLYGVYVFKKNFQCGQVVEYAGEFDYVYRPLLNVLARLILRWRTRQKRRRLPTAKEDSEQRSGDGTAD